MLDAAVAFKHGVQKAQGRERCTGGCLEVSSVAGALLMIMICGIVVDATSRRPWEALALRDMLSCCYDGGCGVQLSPCWPGALVASQHSKLLFCGVIWRHLYVHCWLPHVE
jgi:hypothetical protein